MVNKQPKKDILFIAVTFRDEADHRSTKSWLAAAPGSNTSPFLSLSLRLHKTRLCPAVTNNQEGTGGGILVPSSVCILVLSHPVTLLLWDTRFPWCRNGLTHIQRDSVPETVATLSTGQSYICHLEGREHTVALLAANKIITEQN